MARTKTEILFYGEPQSIDSEGCFAISFTRPLLNSNPVNVNGYDLDAGQTLSIQQNVGDEDWTSYDITFGVGTGENQCQIIKIMPN